MSQENSNNNSVRKRKRCEKDWKENKNKVARNEVYITTVKSL